MPYEKQWAQEETSLGWLAKYSHWAAKLSTNNFNLFIIKDERYKIPETVYLHSIYIWGMRVGYVIIKCCINSSHSLPREIWNFSRVQCSYVIVLQFFEQTIPSFGKASGLTAPACEILLSKQPMKFVCTLKLKKKTCHWFIALPIHVSQMWCKQTFRCIFCSTCMLQVSPPLEDARPHFPRYTIFLLMKYFQGMMNYFLRNFRYPASFVMRLYRGVLCSFFLVGGMTAWLGSFMTLMGCAD